MDLTDEQWRLIGPILAVPVPDLPAPGRPPQEARTVLNGILWKLRIGAAWENLPALYPSHQTCYRYYCEWKKSGSLKAILAALGKDLSVRGGLAIKLAMSRGDIRIFPVARKIKVEFAPRLQDTWQSSTALLFLQLQQISLRCTGEAFASGTQSHKNPCGECFAPTARHQLIGNRL